MDQLPKIVQQGLRGTAKPEVHPDPDLLTAFAEKSLNDRERRHVLQHLAQCADCREVLSLAMPETVTVPPSLDRSLWLTWPMLRWGALAACVVVVGAAVTLRYDGWQAERSVAEKAPSTAVVESNAPQQAGAELATKIAPASSVLADRDFAGAGDKLAKQAEKKSLKAGMALGPAEISVPHALDRAADQPAAPAPMPARKAAEPEQRAKTRNDALDYAARTSNQTVSMESASAPAMEQKAAISELKAKDESSKNELHKEIQTAGAAGGAVVQDRKADTLSAAAATETVEVTSGASAKRSRVKANSLRWTISPEGSPQRSFDSGKNWQTIPVANGVVFRVLTANDSDIWVGGTAGALFHSSDAGEHWNQIKPTADGKSLTSDIITLEFSDASHGRLTTSNDEIWITGDAGKTWQRR